MNKKINFEKSNEECEKMILNTFQGLLVLANDNEPYAIPINHGYKDGSFYFHCGMTGKKLDFIRKNPRVSYVINKYFGKPEDHVKSMKCHGSWESLIVYGTAKIIEEREEYRQAFKTFMEYYGNTKFEPSAEAHTKTRIIKVTAEKMTARREGSDGKNEYFFWEK